MPHHVTELSNQIQTLWKNGTLCDAAIEVGSRVFKVISCSVLYIDKLP